VVILLVAAGLGVTTYLSRLGWQRITGDIAALVRYEEEAAYAGSVNLALAVQDQDNDDWLQVRRDQLVAALPAPAPLPFLRLATPAYAVDAVTALDGDFVTAMVRREFVTAEGQALPFVLPQFYRRRGADDWQRTAPPGQFWGQWQDWRSGYLQIRYSERDAAFVTSVAPRLEAWLIRACELWQGRCAGVLPAKLYLSGFVGSLEHDPLSNVEVQVEFEAGAGALATDYFLSVPSPQLAGLPTEAAGQNYLAQYLAVRLIASLADRAAADPGDYAALAAQAITALQLSVADPGYAALPASQVSVPPAATPAASPTPAPTRTPSAPRFVYYTVQEGDTLSGIAAAYGIDLQVILSANNISDPDVIQAGTVLAIPVP
jgi:LysM repeat protein